MARPMNFENCQSEWASDADWSEPPERRERRLAIESFLAGQPSISLVLPWANGQGTDRFEVLGAGIQDAWGNYVCALPTELSVAACVAKIRVAMHGGE